MEPGSQAARWKAAAPTREIEIGGFGAEGETGEELETEAESETEPESEEETETGEDTGAETEVDAESVGVSTGGAEPSPSDVNGELSTDPNESIEPFCQSINGL